MEVRHKICSVLSGSGSFTVLPAPSTPGKRNKCIRRCVRSPLKNYWEFIFEVMSLTAAEYMGSSFIISSTLRMEESTVE